jgi:hypothetical protein
MKSFEIDKRLVFGAWMKIQANKGAPGVDAVSIEGFADDERDNLYKLWNRMSSASYFPGPVRAVEIPKDHGAGVRVLGVPNRWTASPRPQQRCCWKRSLSRSSTETAMAIVPGVVPMTPWP